MIRVKIDIVRVDDGLVTKLKNDFETIEQAIYGANKQITAYLGFGYKIRCLKIAMEEVKPQRCGNCKFWDRKNSLPTSFTEPRQTKAKCLNAEILCCLGWKLETEGKNCTGYEEESCN